ncbi:flagellar hook-associated protein FlgK [Isoptericola sp. NEAU-Y5]|uniref:Flagellar hook-associated protein 1 n=1 Tax=Isoptericola luteus TaxID=2879484 RepID=A0ABS7ZMY9_9MICO|nr:flagellar hook-associated protein FlgK [Isoptericola sp. NEAU-Y5]MCA5895145.1 flagellar hook-associated protein FlgK [Isoptericola sp. NEAU-Y5]
MSSFAILNTAARGLSAAQAGIDVTGQNVANVNTPGYTRQRVEQSAVAPLTEMGLGRLSRQVTNGQGVSVDGVARLGDLFLEARVRQTASGDGYSSVRAAAYHAAEDIHGEPSDIGVASALQSFWGAWQDVANSPGKDAQGWVVIEQAGALATQIADGRSRVAAEWTQARTRASARVEEVNTLAGQVAILNDRILSSDGGTANELVDQRNQLTDQLARLTGASTSTSPDGTVDVLVGGNLLVDGTRTNQVRLTGSTTLDGTQGDPVRLEWAHRAGSDVDLAGGELAGYLSAMAPASDGGVYAQAAAGYDALATTLATTVNALHASALTPSGDAGGDFFALDPGVPAGAGLRVAVTAPGQVAAGAAGSGALDGSVADAIAGLGLDDDGPDAVWSAHVTQLAVRSGSADYEAQIASAASSAAVYDLQSHSAVSLDEETVNLMQYQHAYSGAARVLTAVDEMLDQLINRTGRVGL